MTQHTLRRLVTEILWNENTQGVTQACPYWGLWLCWDDPPQSRSLMKPILSQDPALRTVEQGIVTHKCPHWLHVHDLNLLTATQKKAFCLLYGWQNLLFASRTSLKCWWGFWNKNAQGTVLLYPLAWVVYVHISSLSATAACLASIDLGWLGINVATTYADPALAVLLSNASSVITAAQGRHRVKGENVCIHARTDSLIYGFAITVRTESRIGFHLL